MELSLALQTDHGLSARRCDRVLSLSRSARYYRPRIRDDGPLMAAIEQHIQANPGHGFGLLFGQALRPQGYGKTRAWRAYVGLKLNFPRRGKRRLPELTASHWMSRCGPTTPGRPTSWPTPCGRGAVPHLNVNDDFNRESLKIEVDSSLPWARVIRALDKPGHPVWASIQGLQAVATSSNVWV